MQRNHQVLLSAVALIISMPLLILAVYAWLFPMVHIKSSFGVILGTSVATGVAFLSIKKNAGVVVGTIGALAVGSIVLISTMLLILNFLGG
jgi:positive regulator of sigma E activity